MSEDSNTVLYLGNRENLVWMGQSRCVKMSFRRAFGMNLGLFHSQREPVKVFTRGRRKSDLCCVQSVFKIASGFPRTILAPRHPGVLSPLQCRSLPSQPSQPMAPKFVHLQIYVCVPGMASQTLCTLQCPLGYWKTSYVSSLLLPVPSFYTRFCVSPLKTELTASAGTWVFHC